ncbi:unnamed protein product, partial [Allacma fusca]
MPKGKSNKGSGRGTPRKGTPGLRNPRRGGGLSDDESLNGDAASILSMNSDRGSYDDVENGNDGLDHDESVMALQSRETLEEKIAEAIDAMTEKSANTRVNSLNTLTTILSQQFVPELVLGRRETLRDNLEKIFKRGQRNEQGMAATLACLASLQIGAFDLDIATEDFGMLKPMLQSLLLDHTVPVAVRVKCCQALSLGAYLAESCLDDVYNLLSILEPLFGVKGKKTSTSEEEDTAVETIDVSTSPSKAVKIPKNSCGNLASAAIASWSLLITLMPPEYLKQRSMKWTQTLLGLLDQVDLEVRLSAGEALALVVEVCDLYIDEDEGEYSLPEDEEDYGSSNGHDSQINGTNGHTNGNSHTNYGFERTSVLALITKLRQLSVESHKYRTKRDRRQQRHSFRDFLHAVENGDGPGQAIKFGGGEVLDIDCWVKKRQYDAICQVLGSGINRHLNDNVLVRQLMELGAPRPQLNDGGYGAKQAKNERQYLNAVNFKQRCVSR